MTTEPTKSLADCVTDGMRYLNEGRYDAALEELGKRREEENCLIPYGKATALFLKHKDSGTLDLRTIDQIVDLYKKVMREEPSMPDAYYMAGYALIAKVALMAKKQNKHQTKKGVEEMYATLMQSERYFEIAVRICPNFEEGIRESLATLRRKKEEARRILNQDWN